MLWGFGHVQEPDGGAVYCRLSTRTIDQPAREIDAALRHDLLAGGYWLAEPAPDAQIALVFSGAIAPELQSAHEALAEEIPGIGLLAITSADRLYGDLLAATEARARGESMPAAHAETLLGRLPPDAALVTVLDGHPAALSWLGTVAGHRAYPLGRHRLRRVRRHSGALRQAPGSIPTPSSTWRRLPASTAPGAAADPISAGAATPLAPHAQTP